MKKRNARSRDAPNPGPVSHSARSSRSACSAWVFPVWVGRHMSQVTKSIARLWSRTATALLVRVSFWRLPQPTSISRATMVLNWRSVSHAAPASTTPSCSGSAAPKALTNSSRMKQSRTPRPTSLRWRTVLDATSLERNLKILSRLVAHG